MIEMDHLGTPLHKAKWFSANANEKPRMRWMSYSQFWVCSSRTQKGFSAAGYGKTPEIAWRNWQRARQ